MFHYKQISDNIVQTIRIIRLLQKSKLYTSVNIFNTKNLLDFSLTKY